MRRCVISLALMALAISGIVIAIANPVRGEPIAKKLFGKMKSPASLSARAIGSYARGCLAGGINLPISGPGWEAMKLWRNRNWGHPQLVKYLERFATEAQTIDGWPGLLIGDLAQPRGGPMITGHKSHQIGLDADIWYRPKPPKPLSKKERADSWSIKLAESYGKKVISKNWKAGYVKVLKRAASYPETARIFVHPAVKRALCEGAGSDRAWLRKIRPWWSHNYHFHVRIKCPAGFKGCKDQKPPPVGDGCGKQLSHWMKKLDAARKWSKKKPKTPPKPKKELRMADLPPYCRAVLNARPGRVNGAASAPLPTRRPATVPAQRAAPSRANTDAGLPWLSGVISAPPPTRKPQ